MGAVDIIVGCPHRLRQPIGPSTKYPCRTCAALGVPPRWATALTIHPSRVRPRLADIATSASRPTPSPLASADLGRLDEVIRAGQAAANAMSEAMAPVVEAARNLSNVLSVQMGAIEVNMMPQTRGDFERNAVRMQASAIMKTGLTAR